MILHQKALEEMKTAGQKNNTDSEFKSGKSHHTPEENTLKKSVNR